MSTITVCVNEDLKKRMDRHPEINWSEVTRQTIADKTAGLERLEQLEQLASGSHATADDVAEIAALVDEQVAHHYEADKELSERKDILRSVR